MSKVIAIIDRPKDCHNCMFGVYKYANLTEHRKGYYCRLKKPQDRVVEDFDYDEEVHLSNCPLKELPQKPDYPPINESSYVAGYNACIDEILGGAE